MPNPEKVFKELAKKYPTPEKVQKFIRTLLYNVEPNGPSLKSAYQTWLKREGHCLEAAFLTAAILENRGYPPLVLSLESQDHLDHVVFVFKAKTGWGSIGKSSEPGLHGREPRFRNIKSLAASYYDPYVDDTGRLTGFGVTSLEAAQCRWRDSERNVWKAERFLIDFSHQKLSQSRMRYRKLVELFNQRGVTVSQGKYWW